jgi:hypothetical protein
MPESVPADRHSAEGADKTAQTVDVREEAGRRLPVFLKTRSELLEKGDFFITDESGVMKEQETRKEEADGGKN